MFNGCPAYLPPLNLNVVITFVVILVKETGYPPFLLTSFHITQPPQYINVDFAGSLGLSREEINSKKINEYVREVATKCKQNNLDLVVGGGVSAESLKVLKEIEEVKLTRFETRKIVFSGQAVSTEGIDAGLLNAVHFEMLWLLNKRDY